MVSYKVNQIIWNRKERQS